MNGSADTQFDKTEQTSIKNKHYKACGTPSWQGRHHDREGGFPRARLSHCTPDVLTLRCPQMWESGLHYSWLWGSAFTLSPLVKK